MSDQVKSIEYRPNSYINDRKAIDRLKKEYNEHQCLVIGFDFDCTIFDYHKEKLDILPVELLLRRCSDRGLTMCLYTLTPEGSFLKDKLDYLTRRGIRVDYINASNILIEQNTVAPPKPFFSILLDDRAGLASAYKILSTTLDELGL
jgi:hypothetical protein